MLASNQKEREYKRSATLLNYQGFRTMVVHEDIFAHYPGA